MVKVIGFSKEFESMRRKSVFEAEEYDDTFGDASDINLTGDLEKDFDTLINKLRKTDYEDLGEELKNICDDPKLYALLSKGFGNGELADVKMSSSVIAIPVKQLLPSQSEIGLDNSLKFPLKSDNLNGGINLFKDPVTVVAPIVTYRKTFIVDGHHRWSELYMINPNAKIAAINFNYEQDSPWRALRNFQGAIAVANKDVPKNYSKVNNVYEMSEEQIRKYVENNITDECIQSLIDAKAENRAVAVADRDTAIEYIVENALDLKADNKPFSNAPDREYMPQTDDSSINVAKAGQTNI